MDLIAALGLAMAFEGLALWIMADRLPELAARLAEIPAATARLAGITLVAGGGAVYLLVAG